MPSVELEFHAGSGWISSRARAAPYAAAARTPSTVKVGYCRMISSSFRPAAKQSRRTLTGIRVPRHGLDHRPRWDPPRCARLR